jgi:hypothetical protein
MSYIQYVELVKKPYQVTVLLKLLEYLLVL